MCAFVNTCVFSFGQTAQVWRVIVLECRDSLALASEAIQNLMRGAAQKNNKIHLA